MASTGKAPRSNRLRAVHGQAPRPPVPVPANLMSGVSVPEMSPEARAIWDRTAPSLIERGVIDPWSADIYGRLCWLQAKAAQLRKLIDVEGPLAVGAANQEPVRHPAWTPLRQCDTEIARLELRFGLAPADRSRVDVDSGDAADPDDDYLTHPTRPVVRR